MLRSVLLMTIVLRSLVHTNHTKHLSFSKTTTHKRSSPVSGMKWGRNGTERINILIRGNSVFVPFPQALGLLRRTFSLFEQSLRVFRSARVQSSVCESGTSQFSRLRNSSHFACNVSVRIFSRRREEERKKQFQPTTALLLVNAVDCWRCFWYWCESECDRCWVAYKRGKNR